MSVDKTHKNINKNKILEMSNRCALPHKNRRILYTNQRKICRFIFDFKCETE